MRWIVLVLALWAQSAQAQTPQNSVPCRAAADMTPEAILSCDITHAAGQDRLTIYSRRMLILQDRENYAAALTAVNHLLNLVPDYAHALTFRAHMLMILGEHEAALATANRVLQHKVGRSSRALATARMIRATVRARNGDHIGALSDIAILDRDQAMGSALLVALRARHQAYLGNDVAAHKSLTHLFLHQDPTPQSQRIAVQALLLLGASDRAMDLAQSIPPDADSKMEHWAAIGLAACQTGQPEKAFLYLRAAAEEARWFQLLQAIILREAGHVTEPVATLRRPYQAAALRAWIAEACPAPF